MVQIANTDLSIAVKKIGKYEFDNNDFGKTVFLAKSEAEAKLKELRGNQDGKI